MSRPLKILTVAIKTRNAAISPETSKFILKATNQIARKIASNWGRYTCPKALANDIATETYVAILTSSTFNPDAPEKQLYCYLRATAQNKANTLTASLKKMIERHAKLDDVV